VKKISVGKNGGPEVLTVEEAQKPQISADEVLIDVAAAGVNFIDIYQREGLYPLALPFTPGLEGSGIVAEVGADVEKFSPGDRVAWTGQLGSYSEILAIPSEKLLHIPREVSLETAASTMLQGITAHYLVTSVYTIQAETQALVHAAAGGVGLLLTQMIRSRGGTVIATVSSDAKADAVLRAGASEVINYEQEDFQSKVMSITNGRGVDVVYDGVGQSTFAESLRSLTTRGTLALFGQSSGPVAPFDPQMLNQYGSLTLIRPNLADFTASEEELEWRGSEIFSSIVDKSLSVRVHDRYPLQDASEAQRALASRETLGKLMLTME